MARILEKFALIGEKIAIQLWIKVLKSLDQPVVIQGISVVRFLSCV